MDTEQLPILTQISAVKITLDAKLLRSIFTALRISALRLLISDLCRNPSCTLHSCYRYPDSIPSYSGQMLVWDSREKPIVQRSTSVARMAMYIGSNSGIALSLNHRKGTIAQICKIVMKMMMKRRMRIVIVMIVRMSS